MRDANDLPGVHAVRTMFSAKKRSMPRVQGSGYLDLFMLGKEKKRLLKESERLAARQTVTKKRLEEVDKEVSKLQGAEVVQGSSSVGFSGRAFTEKAGAKKEWKKMALNY